jgi:hypothetical protein
LAFFSVEEFPPAAPALAAPAEAARFGDFGVLLPGDVDSAPPPPPPPPLGLATAPPPPPAAAAAAAAVFFDMSPPGVAGDATPRS